MRSSQAGVFAAAALVALLPGAALAQTQATLEHAGSVGLLVAAGPEFATVEFADCISCRVQRAEVGFGGILEVGGSVAIGNGGDELTLRARLVRLTGDPGEALLAGYRSYYGYEEWKTFFSLDALGAWRPIRALGARAGFGVMRELSPVLGASLELGTNLGLGGGRRFGVELIAGLQARSYLLE